MIRLIASLYVLLVLDSAFSGICAGSGRQALIHKNHYYLRAMIRGAWWGHVACILGVSILGLTIWIGPDRRQTIDEMLVVGRRMTVVYWIYAAVVLFTFLVRAIPSVDIRAMTSTLGFGPLTLIRPVVVLAGVVWGLQVSPSIHVAVAALAIAALMMPFRVFLDRQIGFFPIATGDDS